MKIVALAAFLALAGLAAAPISASAAGDQAGRHKVCQVHGKPQLVFPGHTATVTVVPTSGPSSPTHLFSNPARRLPCLSGKGQR